MEVIRKKKNLEYSGGNSYGGTNSPTDDISSDHIKTDGCSLLAHKRFAPSTVQHSLTPLASYSGGSPDIDPHLQRRSIPAQRREDAESSCCEWYASTKSFKKLLLSVGFCCGILS